MVGFSETLLAAGWTSTELSLLTKGFLAVVFFAVMVAGVAVDAFEEPVVAVLALVILVVGITEAVVFARVDALVAVGALSDIDEDCERILCMYLMSIESRCQCHDSWRDHVGSVFSSCDGVSLRPRDAVILERVG